MNAVGYVVAFAVGTIIGMAALSFVASYPLGVLERCAGWFNNATSALIGSAALIIGSRLFLQSWGTL